MPSLIQTGNTRIHATYEQLVIVPRGFRRHLRFVMPIPCSEKIRAWEWDLHLAMGPMENPWPTPHFMGKRNDRWIGRGPGRGHAQDMDDGRWWDPNGWYADQIFHEDTRDKVSAKLSIQQGPCGTNCFAIQITIIHPILTTVTTIIVMVIIKHRNRNKNTHTKNKITII